MSSEKKVENIRGKLYYSKKAQAITKLQDRDYYNPSQDVEDPRQSEIWTLAEEAEFSIDILENYDCDDLYPPDSENIVFFQTRANGEEGVKELYEDIYLSEEKLRRIPFGMYIGEGEKRELCIIVGNKRMRMHELAIKVHEQESKCDVVVLDHHDMSDLEKKEFAMKIARLSNSTEKVKNTRESTREDHIHQLRGQYEHNLLKKGLSPDTDPWSHERKISWGKSWIIKNISKKYENEHMKAALGNIVNSVFSEARGLSIPMPSAEDLKEKFQEFWPTYPWDEDSTAVKMKRMATYPQPIERIIYKFWENQEEASVCSHNRHPFYFIMRCGQTLDSKLTSVLEINKARKKTLDYFKQINTKKKLVDHKFPLVAKVMFVKQLTSDSNDYVAHQWNELTSEFDPVERKGE